MTQVRDLSEWERKQLGCGCFTLIGLAAVAAFGSLGDAMCETTTYARATSPSSLVAATVRMTDCGATTGFSRVVWVQPVWLPTDPWVSCRAAAFSGQPAVSLRWSRDSLAIVADTKPENLIAQSQTCFGSEVMITFKPSPNGS